MNLNTYSRPRITIGDKEVEYFQSFNIRFPGGNDINSITINNIEKSIMDYSLLNQEIVVYLNEGSNDSVPIFRGLIKNVTPSKTGVSLKAYDPRIIMSGKNSFPIIVDDNENFDGHTLVQFMYKYISEDINTDGIKIGLDMLTETTPKLLMREFRTDLAVPYQIMKDCLSQIIDDSDIENPIDYEIIMIDDGVKSNITLRETTTLENADPVIRYDLLDGVQSITFKKSPPPNFALIRGDDEIQTKYQSGNMATGKTGITISGPYIDRNSAKRAGIIEIFRNRKEINDISLSVTKGYSVGIGSIINLYINDNINETFDISGNHRVTSKTINYSNTNGCTMKLTLNNKALKVSDFIG